MALPVLKGHPVGKQTHYRCVWSVNDDERDSNESCRPINSHFEGFNLRPIKEPSATMDSTALAMSRMGPPKVRSSI